MDDNEYLLEHAVAERLREARAAAARRAMVTRPRRERAPFAMWAKIVENARRERTNAHRRVLIED
jgi:hypothetical protein